MAEIKDIFISWNQKDVDLKNKIAAALALEGYSYYDSEYHTNGNINENCIENALKSKVLVVLLTENSLKSEWVNREIEAFRCTEQKDNIIGVTTFKIEELKDRIEKYSKEFDIKISDDNINVLAKNVSFISRENDFNEKGIEQLKQKVHDSLTSFSYISYVKRNNRFRLLDDTNQLLDKKEVLIKRKEISEVFNILDSNKKEDKDIDYILVEGMPAIGKTTFMNSIYQECLENHDDFFPIEFKANEIVNKFNEENEDDNKNIFEKLIVNRVKNRCDLPDNIDIENDIINSSHINKIIIIIDSFDEVKENRYLDNFYNTLKRKLSDSKYKAILSSRKFDYKFPEEKTKRINLVMLDEFEKEKLIKENNIEIKKKNLIESETPFELQLKIKLIRENNDDINVLNNIKIYDLLDRYYSLIKKFNKNKEDGYSYVSDEEIEGVAKSFINEKLITYAYNDLTKAKNEKLDFSKDKAKNEKIINQLRKKLILSKDDEKIIFYNKTVESYFASLYINEEVSKCKDEEAAASKGKELLEPLLNNIYNYDTLLLVLSISDKDDYFFDKESFAYKYIKQLYYDIDNNKINEKWLSFVDNYESYLSDLKKTLTKCKNQTLKFLITRSLSKSNTNLLYGIVLQLIQQHQLYKVFIKIYYDLFNGYLDYINKDDCINFIVICSIVSDTYLHDRNISKDESKESEDESNNNLLNDIFEKIKAEEIDIDEKYLDDSNIRELFSNLEIFTNEKILDIFKEINNKNGLGLLYVENIKELENIDISNYSNIIINQKTKYDDYDPNLFSYNIHLRSIYLIGIDEIKDEFFSGVKNLRTCYIFNNNKEIKLGIKSFSQCKLLTKIISDSSVNCIPDYSFEDCQELKTVILKGVTKIGKSAFNGDFYLEFNDIFNLKNVEEIGEYSFYNCKKIKSIEVSEKLNYIPKSAFENCQKLNSIRLENGNSPRFLNIGESSFAETGFKDISNIILYLKDIPNYAFKNCKLEGELILDHITRIGKAAFRDCAMEKLKINDCHIIDEESFFSCKNFKKVDLISNNSIKKIELGIKSFANCYSLEEISIRAKDLIINDFSFFNCNNLNKVYINNEKENVNVKLGIGAFSFCKNLSNDIFDNCNLDSNEYAFYNIPSNYDYEENPTNDFEKAAKNNIKLFLKKLTINDLYDKRIFNNQYTEEIEFDIDKKFTCLKPYMFNNYSGLKSITLPNTLEIINKGCFNNCKSLEKIEIPKKVIKIEDNAFNNCESLKEIEISDSVNEIGEYAFSSSGIKNIKIPNNLKIINKGCFNNCKSLEKIEIPKSIEVIKEYALSYSGIRTISFYSSTKLNFNSLFSMPCLKEIKVINNNNLDENKIKENIENALGKSLYNIKVNINNKTDELILINEKEIIKENIIISKEKISDPNYQYINLEELYKYDLKCKKIKIIGLKELKIDFSGNEYLEEIVLDDKLKKINRNVFNNCKNLKKINLENVEEILEYAFSGCEKLERINLGKLSIINKNVFAKCTSLFEINLSDDLKEIQGGAFSNTIISKLNISNKNTLIIKNYAFRDNKNLNEIQINVNKCIIESNAFSGCLNLEKLYIESKNNKGIIIKTNAFDENNINLKNIKFNTIPRIEYKGLPSKRGGELRLNNYNWNKYIDCINNKYILKKDFNIYNYSLLFVEKNLNLDILKAFRFNSFFTTIKFEEGIKIIGKDLLSNVLAEKIILPNTITSIGDRAFKSNQILDEIEIPDSVTSIGVSAFEKCYSLKTVTLSNKLRVLNNNLFLDDYSLYEIKNSNCIEEIRSNVFENTIIEKIDLADDIKLAEASFANSNLESIDLSKSKLETIPKNCFYGTRCLRNIVLPNTLKCIEEGAFEISAIEKMDILNVTDIRDRAFYNSSIKSICLKNVLNIGSSAFEDCENITKIELDNLINVGPSAFKDTNIIEVILNKNITYISPQLFASCDKLKKVVLKGENITIGDASFSGDDTLESINLNNVVKIEKRAFKYCKAIKEYNLAKVKEIGSGAFINNLELEKFSANSIERIEDEILFGCRKLKEIYLNKVKSIPDKFINGCYFSLAKMELKEIDKIPKNVLDNIRHNVEIYVKSNFDTSENENILIKFKKNMPDC